MLKQTRDKKTKYWMWFYPSSQWTLDVSSLQRNHLILVTHNSEENNGMMQQTSLYQAVDYSIELHLQLIERLNLTLICLLNTMHNMIIDLPNQRTKKTLNHEFGTIPINFQLYKKILQITSSLYIDLSNGCHFISTSTIS